MFMNRKPQYYKDVSSSQLDLQIQCSHSQKHSKPFCEYRQSASEIYMERQKTQNCQHNIEREEQSLTTFHSKTYYDATVIKTM